MTEASIVNAIVKALKTLGPDAFWTVNHGTTYARRGYPDLTITIRGRTFWLECKAPGRRPTKLQQAIHRKIRRAGGTVHVVDCLETARSCLAQYVP